MCEARPERAYDERREGECEAPLGQRQALRGCLHSCQLHRRTEHREAAPGSDGVRGSRGGNECETLGRAWAMDARLTSVFPAPDSPEMSIDCARFSLTRPLNAIVETRTTWGGAASPSLHSREMASDEHPLTGLYGFTEMMTGPIAVSASRVREGQRWAWETPVVSGWERFDPGWAHRCRLPRSDDAGSLARLRHSSRQGR